MTHAVATSTSEADANFANTWAKLERRTTREQRTKAVLSLRMQQFLFITNLGSKTPNLRLPPSLLPKIPDSESLFRTWRTVREQATAISEYPNLSNAAASTNSRWHARAPAPSPPVPPATSTNPRPLFAPTPPTAAPAMPSDVPEPTPSESRRPRTLPHDAASRHSHILTGDVKPEGPPRRNDTADAGGAPEARDPFADDEAGDPEGPAPPALPPRVWRPPPECAEWEKPAARFEPFRATAASFARSSAVAVARCVSPRSAACEAHLRNGTNLGPRRGTSRHGTRNPRSPENGEENPADTSVVHCGAWITTYATGITSTVLLSPPTTATTTVQLHGFRRHAHRSPVAVALDV